jgi:hypothetical protein
MKLATESIPPEITQLTRVVDSSGLRRSEVARLAEMSPGNLTRLLSGRRSNASLAVVGRVLAACGENWAALDP